MDKGKGKKTKKTMQLVSDARASDITESRAAQRRIDRMNQAYRRLHPNHGGIDGGENTYKP